MWDSGHNDVLISFLADRNMRDEDSRTVLGIALLAARHPKRLFPSLESLTASGQTLDTGLLWNVLQAATPHQLSQILWSPVGLHISSEWFELLLTRVLTRRVNLRSLYESIGGAVDFLRVHHGPFVLPQIYLRRLVRSRNVQLRIVGIKGMNWSDVSPTRHVEYLFHSLQSVDEEERLAAIYCLGELIDLRGSDTFAKVNVEVLQKLDQLLTSFTDSNDQNLRMSIESHRRFLQAFIDPKK